MIWGVSFLRQGWHIDYAEAVNRASMVPLGWVIGAPVLGYISDRMGRRKPVLMAGMALMLGDLRSHSLPPANTLPPYLLGLLLGIGSGAAMIPYTIIKEVNPDNVKGSATGAINFLVFVMSAFAAPAFGWLLQKLAGWRAAHRSTSLPRAAASASRRSSSRRSWRCSSRKPVRRRNASA